MRKFVCIFMGKGAPYNEQTQRAVLAGIPAVVDHCAGVSDYLRFAVRQSRAVSGVHCVQTVQNQLSAQLTENAELSGTLEQGDSAIIERYAREQGYAKPNERVFVDISGK